MASERGMQIKADINRVGWEESEMPIVCESCLGPNPYVRMIKAPFGQACNICERPYTVFRWKPGPKARYKKTVICQICSKSKNACQVCMLDLTYGLPIQVRDEFLGQYHKAAQSQVMMNYQAQQMAQQAADGTLPYQGDEPHEQLLRMARMRPNYDRNKPKLCSFFMRGECTRGDECPYLHEMPKHAHDDPFSKQTIKDRFWGENDPVAKAMLEKSQSVPTLEPPTDKDIKTLWLGGIPDEASEADIRDQCYAYGEIVSLKLIDTKRCAFVEYLSRAQAEAAASNLHSRLIIHGRKIDVSWAKPQKQGEGANSGLHGARAGAALAGLAMYGDDDATAGPPAHAPVVRLNAAAMPPAGGKGQAAMPSSLGGMPLPPGMAAAGGHGPMRKAPVGASAAAQAQPYSAIPSGHAPAKGAKPAAAPGKAYYPSMDPSAMGSRYTET